MVLLTKTDCFGGNKVTKTKTLLAAGAVALGMATSASAITVTSGMSVDITPNVNNAFEIIFDWPNAPDDGITTLPIAFDFDLTVEDRSGMNPLIGYYVTDPNGNRLEDSTSTTCSGMTGVVQCNLLFQGQPTPTTLFSNLTAGTYTFGVIADTVQNTGSITFGITKVSEVPLPAGGLLLLTALGGIAATRRRKG